MARQKHWWPYWDRDLTPSTVSFTFDAEQASALVHDLCALIERGEVSELIAELYSRLAFDTMYLEHQQKTPA
jgi:methylphosphotriester-DNA--protein-cysteine methyltransferase